MANLVIRDKNGAEVTYEGVEKVKFNTNDGGTQLYSEGDTVENIPIALNFSEGDQIIEAPSGYLVKSAVIAKPENLVPENIREDETVAGVAGTLPAYEVLENVPIALDFSDGNQAVTVPDGNVVKSAIIQKPETLLPENIVEGVRIAGIDGTNKGSGKIDLEGDFLKYVVYQLDDDNKEIIICGILYRQLYADTGSYDVNIPAKFGEYHVVIDSEGVY